MKPLKKSQVSQIQVISIKFIEENTSLLRKYLFPLSHLLIYTLLNQNWNLYNFWFILLKQKCNEYKFVKNHQIRGIWSQNSLGKLKIPQILVTPSLTHHHTRISLYYQSLTYLYTFFYTHQPPIFISFLSMFTLIKHSHIPIHTSIVFIFPFSIVQLTAVHFLSTVNLPYISFQQ